MWKGRGGFNVCEGVEGGLEPRFPTPNVCVSTLLVVPLWLNTPPTFTQMKALNPPIETALGGHPWGR